MHGTPVEQHWLPQKLCPTEHFETHIPPVVELHAKPKLQGGHGVGGGALQTPEAQVDPDAHVPQLPPHPSLPQFLPVQLGMQTGGATQALFWHLRPFAHTFPVPPQPSAAPHAAVAIGVQQSPLTHRCPFPQPQVPPQPSLPPQTPGAQLGAQHAPLKHKAALIGHVLQTPPQPSDPHAVFTPTQLGAQTPPS